MLEERLLCGDHLGHVWRNVQVGGDLLRRDDGRLPIKSNDDLCLSVKLVMLPTMPVCAVRVLGADGALSDSFKLWKRLARRWLGSMPLVEPWRELGFGRLAKLHGFEPQSSIGLVKVLLDCSDGGSNLTS